MFLNSVFSRKTDAQRGLSHLTLAIALATGGVVASGALFAAPAYAQKAESNTKDFVAAYQPVAEIVNAEDGDYASAKAMLPGVLEKIGNEQDRYVMGSLVFSLGNKLTDSALQRQGLELMVASGKVAPEQVGQFNYFIGSLAFDAKDFAAARPALQKAIDAGYEVESATGLLAEAYFADGLYKQGADYLTGAMTKLIAEGGTPPENWYLRALQMTTQNDLPAESMQIAQMLVKAYPTSKNWGYATGVTRDVVKYDPADAIDIYRLMLRTNGFLYENDIREYVDLADQRGVPGEVLKILSETEGNSLRSADSTFYSDALEISTGKAKTDRAELAEAKASVEAADSKPVAIISTGDAFLSYDDPATAESLYQLALTREGVDTNRALTRTAIAQIDQGKYAEARETLTKVTGNHRPLADLWLIYLDQQQGA